VPGSRISSRLAAVTSVTVLTLALAPPILAQGASVGVLGGINYAEINASGSELLNVQFTAKMEPVFGAIFPVEVARSLWIEPEVLLSVKGSKLDVGDGDEHVRLTYLEAPVLLRYAAPEGSPVKLHLSAGAYLAYLLNANSRNEGRGRELDLDDAFESFDFGWVIGFGVGSSAARVELRYSGGISDLADVPDLGGVVPVQPETRFRNRAFVLVAAVAF
jgi:hypothetical protein